ncbi:hypothetical protein MES4922_650004 [Mesorhizobium ventifaucium]|uniref:Uncharacterized protein n=1 Tax=Mesorhizobium ventifaucium TaxID=666020 RepID=A0ABM9EDP7_9HYPH|nr:hypothetical protein MES4922_650004 [Mesorhizobium ventifaucium]
MLPMLEAWRSIRTRAAELGRQLSQMPVKAKHAAYSCRSPEVGAMTTSCGPRHRMSATATAN